MFRTRISAGIARAVHPFILLAIVSARLLAMADYHNLSGAVPQCMDIDSCFTERP